MSRTFLQKQLKTLSGYTVNFAHMTLSLIPDSLSINITVRVCKQFGMVGSIMFKPYTSNTLYSSPRLNKPNTGALPPTPSPHFLFRAPSKQLSSTSISPLKTFPVSFIASNHRL